MLFYSLWVSLFGCDYGFTLPAEQSVPADVKPGDKIPIRPRRSILPGSVTGPPPPDAGITQAQCSTISDGGPLEGSNECLTAKIACGETVIGHTRGGVNLYNTKFYEQKFCTPATTQHDGGDERVYLLELPEPNTRAIVYLDTPCADLDLAAMQYASGNHCPSNSSNVPRCEMTRKEGTAREKVDLFNDSPSQWWIVVEGVGDEEGAFSLTVQCEEWRK